jgi:chaperonin cofactor prefoldin
MNHHQQQIDHLILASSTIAAQLAELKALRKQVEEWSDHISRQTGSAYAKPACGPAG